MAAAFITATSERHSAVPPTHHTCCVWYATTMYLKHNNILIYLFNMTLKKDPRTILSTALTALSCTTCPLPDPRQNCRAPRQVTNNFVLYVRRLTKQSGKLTTETNQHKINSSTNTSSTKPENSAQVLFSCFGRPLSSHTHILPSLTQK